MANSVEQMIAAMLTGAKHDTDWLLAGHRRELEELDQKLLADEITLQRALEYVAIQRRRIREAYSKPDAERQAEAPAQLNRPRPVPEQGRLPPRPVPNQPKQVETQ